MSDASPPGGVPALVDDLFRREAGRLTALLTRLLGPAQLALAEDVTQEAFIAALQHWPRSGVPQSPAAWLLQVARRKALDALRRDQALADRAPVVAAALEEREALLAAGPGGAADGAFEDEQLRMILLCCHPAISEESRVALTLKLVGGFSVGEIARAFLADEAAVAQRLVRAKRALRDAGARFEPPAGEEMRQRLDAVLDVLYLMFNEGHTAHEGEALMREDLCREALRLAELLAHDPQAASPRVHALAALFCFHAARFEARTDADGALVRLAEQDRARWDQQLLARGMMHLDRSAAGDELTTYHLEAEIAGCHTVARSHEATDWPRILRAYDQLLARTRSPVVAINRAVALREVRGADAAMRELEQLDATGMLRRYHTFHGVRAELLEALGQPGAAAAAWREALALTRSAPLRRFIERRLDALRRSDVDSGADRPS